MEISDDPKQPTAADVAGGTTFTINLGEVELSEEEKKSIMNDITQVAMKRSQAASAVAAQRIIFGRFGSFGSFGRVIVFA